VVVVRSFDELQSGLGPVLGVHRDGGRAEHVMVTRPGSPCPRNSWTGGTSWTGSAT